VSIVLNIFAKQGNKTQAHIITTKMTNTTWTVTVVPTKFYSAPTRDPLSPLAYLNKAAMAR